MALPAPYVLSFVIDDSAESLFDGPDIPLYVRSRMFGVLGIAVRTAMLRESVRADLADQIAVYKQLRGTFRESSAQLLSPQASVVNPPAWDVVQDTDAAGNAIIFAFQSDTGVRRILVKPRSLRPDTTYDVWSVDVGVLGAATGAALMTEGIEVSQNPSSAAHIIVLSAQLSGAFRIK